MPNTLKTSPEEQILYWAIDSILWLVWIEWNAQQVNRGIISDAGVISWPFFDWFHSEKESAWVKWERVYHLVLNDGSEVIVSYDEMNLAWYTCVSIASLKQKPWVWEILWKIKEAEEKTRVDKGVETVAKDRVHALI